MSVALLSKNGSALTSSASNTLVSNVSYVKLNALALGSIKILLCPRLCQASLPFCSAVSSDKAPPVTVCILPRKARGRGNVGNSTETSQVGDCGQRTVLFGV